MRHKPDMTKHKEFVENGVKAKKGTLRERVAKKDTQTGLGIEFVGKNRDATRENINNQKTWSLEGSGALLNNLSNEEPRERLNLRHSIY